MVYCVDFVRPPSYDLILGAVLEVAPWVADKIQFVEINVDRLLVPGQDILPLGTSVIAIHACGLATDISIDVS